MEIRDVQGRQHMIKVTTMKVLEDKDHCQYHCEDVTEKVQMRKRLLASEDLTKKLLDAHPDPSFITDVTGTVTCLNERTNALFDLTAGKDGWTHIVSDFDVEPANDLLPNVRSKGRCLEKTIHLKGKEGSQYIGSIDVEPLLGLDGSHSGFLFIIKKVAQNGNASPDMMLGAIGPTFATLPSEESSGGGSIPLPQCTSDALTNSRTLSSPAPKTVKGKKEQLAEDYAMIGKESPRWYSLQEMCVSAAMERGDDLDSLGEIDKVEMFADPLILKVIGKLIDNALEHGGNVDKVDIKYFVGDKGAYIVVEDNGKGIANERKEAIFDYAYEGRNGHDLHFVREVLAVTKLEITEVGEHGKGARFEIFLPHDKHRRPKA